MIPPPRFRRTTATTMTMALRISPAFARPFFPPPLSSMPIAAITAPMAAKGITSQFIAPSSGTSARIIHSSATMPHTRLITPIVDSPVGGGAGLLSWRSKHAVDLDAQFAPADRSVQQDARDGRVQVYIEQCRDARQRVGIAHVHLQPRGRAEARRQRR